MTSTERKLEAALVRLSNAAHDFIENATTARRAQLRDALRHSESVATPDTRDKARNHTLGLEM